MKLPQSAIKNSTMADSAIAPGLMSRRKMLQRCSTGFGMTALSALLADPVFASRAALRVRPARARNVIFCYMSGGPSHVDSFDPKPRLAKEAGKPMPMKLERTTANDNGKIFPTPFEFRRHGESGIPVSDLIQDCVANMGLRKWRGGPKKGATVNTGLRKWGPPKSWNP